ncbi:MAG TPA: hypothetical protein VIS96_12910 [Terrimicrobiaceae bacterium]
MSYQLVGFVKDGDLFSGKIGADIDDAGELLVVVERRGRTLVDVARSSHVMFGEFREGCVVDAPLLSP